MITIIIFIKVQSESQLEEREIVGNYRELEQNQTLQLQSYVSQQGFI